jgi:glycosyltransferase family protein
MVPLIKQIWENRGVCIIEGEFTRLGIGNDLLANAKSVYRILAPSTNAFDKYDVLKETVKIYSTKSDLILIALGMTATCLAYDLAKEGYQAIDIGHVDVEYEWFRMKAKGRVPVNNKYVAESKERLIGDGNIDSLYFSQIRVRVL